MAMEDDKDIIGGQIVFYQPDASISLEVRLDMQSETVWLTQQQIADLFGVQQPAISKHLNNIFRDGELEKDSVHSILEYTASDGKNYKTHFYNLDAILSVGYRVNSRNATLFRKWATGILKDYLLKGYSINRQLVAMQEQSDNRFLQIEQKINKQQEQIDFFIRTNIPPIEGVFYEGQVFDARLFVDKLIQIAQHEIVLIDNYIDARTFDILQMRGPEVSASIYVERIGSGLRSLQQLSQMQTGRAIELLSTRQRVHDRFLIIDNEVYHVGASLNELGKRLFAFSRLQMDKSIIINQVK